MRPPSISALALAASLAAGPAPAQDAAGGGRPPAVSPQAISAESLLDKELYGGDGRNIGAVRNVIVGGPGQAAVLVIGIGGFLGLGEREAAVPFAQVRIDENGRLTTTLTKREVGPPPPP